MKKFIFVLITVLIMALLISSANAYSSLDNGIRFNEWNIYQQGIGSIEINRERTNIDSCEIHLYRNGDGVLTFFGFSTWTFSGIWQYTGSNTVYVRITDANGSSVRNGNCTLVLTATEFTNVFLSGRTEGTAFNLLFTPIKDNCWYGNNNNCQDSSIAQLQQMPSGIGNLSYDGKTTLINKASFNLNITRRGTITLYGNSSIKITGNWYSPNEFLVNFTILSIDGKPATGSGTISLQNLKIRSALINARLNNKPWSLSFTAK